MDGDYSHEIRRHFASWMETYDKPRQCIKKQRYHFADKGLYGQSYDFSSTHVRMWELDYKKLSAKELMLLNCGAGKDAWESLGQQGDQNNQS